MSLKIFPQAIEALYQGHRVHGRELEVWVMDEHRIGLQPVQVECFQSYVETEVSLNTNTALEIDRKLVKNFSPVG